MTRTSTEHRGLCLSLGVFLGLWATMAPQGRSQNPELQQRLAEVKAALVKNKQQLAQYTWMEQDIISLKGEEWKEELFQVRLGPDGKAQKTNLDPAAMSDDERHRHGLKAHIVEKKKEEHKEYADSMKNLMQQYVPPDKSQIDQADQKGNVMIGPAGVPDELRLVITTEHCYRFLSWRSSDAVKLNVQFSSLPDGTNHISTLVIDGVSKQLSVTLTNTNYQKLWPAGTVIRDSSFGSSGY